MGTDYPQGLPRQLALLIREAIQKSVAKLQDEQSAKTGLAHPGYVLAMRYDEEKDKDVPRMDEDGNYIWQAIGTAWAKTVLPVTQSPKKSVPEAVVDDDASMLYLLQGACKVVLDEFLYLNSSDIGVEKTEGENPQWSLNMSGAKITGLTPGTITPANTEAVTGGAVYNHVHAQVHPLPRIAQAEIDSATPPTELEIAVSGALVVQVYQWDETESAWRLLNPGALQIAIYDDHVTITGFTLAGKYRATALYSLA